MIDIFNPEKKNSFTQVNDQMFATFLGGKKEEICWDVAIDSVGNAYITGYTNSSDFPVLNAYDSNYNGKEDVFIAKFSSNGSLLWSTFLGGNRSDFALSIAVDSEENVYITGYTNSRDFPVLNAYDSSYNGEDDVFVAKFSSNGSLLWSTFLGGTDRDWGYGIAVDSVGNIYVTGSTNSSDFSVKNAYDSSHNYGYDAFVVKFSSNGSLLWSTFLGGPDDDWGLDVAVDSRNNAYITGTTAYPYFKNASYYGDWGVENFDVFVAKFSSNGSLLWTKFQEGNNNDWSYGIALDFAGNAYITGYTESEDFAVLTAYESSFNGKMDVFVSKFSSNGSLLWSTFLGGNDYDWGLDVVVDSEGNAYITGSTRSSDFPVKYAYDFSCSGDRDAFLAKFSSNGSLLWNTFLGGKNYEYGLGVVVDSKENVYITGITNSSDFSVKNAYDSSYNGDWDVFISKVFSILQDKDYDGLNNINEYWLGTSPTNADTDGDGMPDGWEIKMSFNPRDPQDANQDRDKDGLSNLGEYFFGTDPDIPDTDGDGFRDGIEVNLRTNPTKKLSSPLTFYIIPLSIIFIILLFSFIGYLRKKRLIHYALLSMKKALVVAKEDLEKGISMLEKSIENPYLPKKEKTKAIQTLDNLKKEFATFLGAPDYLSALEVKKGGFKNYAEYMKALKLGAHDKQELLLVHRFGAPNYETALAVKKGGFSSYEEYMDAKKLGVDNKYAFDLLKSTGAPNLSEAWKIKALGFDRYEDYLEAKKHQF